MNYKTVNEAAALLHRSPYDVRRLIREGVLPSLKLGDRLMVDVDRAREALRRFEGASLKEVCEATGLTERQLRRAVKDGLLPCVRDGRRMVFDLKTVLKVLNEKTK